MAAADAVDVRLDPDLERTGWLGQLRIEGSRPLEREVRGERCQDVVEALALITVLRLEGGDAGAGSSAAASPGAATAAPSGSAVGAGSTAPGSTAPGEAAAAPSESPPATSPAPQSPAAEPAPSAPPQPPPSSPLPAAESAESPETATEAEPAPAEPADAARTPEESSDRSAFTGAPASGVAPAEPSSEPPLRPDEPITVPAGTERVEVDSEASDASSSEPLRAELAPTLALLAGYASVPGHALELTLASEVRYGETLRSWTSPVALTVTLGSERVDAADLDFTLLTAQLGLCPPAPLAESWAWLRLCANMRGGAVRAEITPRVPELEDEPPSWRPWLAVVPSLEIGIPLSEHWTIRAGVELAVQLVRDTFAAALDAGPDPDVLPLYEPDAVSVEGALGVGYTF